MTTVSSIHGAPMNRLKRAFRRRALKRATARTNQAFVRQEPQWQEVLFDEYFITHRGAAVLTAYLRGLAPGPVALAQACADQWGWDPEGRAKFVAALTPSAARFLDLFEHELHGTGTSNRTELLTLAGSFRLNEFSGLSDWLGIVR